MSKLNAAEDAGMYSFVIAEQENKELAQEQVREINNGLRRVRNLVRDSQRMARPVTEQVALAASPREDDTDKFCIPEPSNSPSPLTAVLAKALDILEKERREYTSTVTGKRAPVVKRWTLL